MRSTAGPAPDGELLPAQVAGHGRDITCPRGDGPSRQPGRAAVTWAVGHQKPDSKLIDRPYPIRCQKPGARRAVLKHDTPAVRRAVQAVCNDPAIRLHKLRGGRLAGRLLAVAAAHLPIHLPVTAANHQATAHTHRDCHPQAVTARCAAGGVQAVWFPALPGSPAMMMPLTGSGSPTLVAEVPG